MINCANLVLVCSYSMRNNRGGVVLRTHTFVYPTEREEVNKMAKIRVIRKDYVCKNGTAVKGTILLKALARGISKF